MGHTSRTTMARYFKANRGKALAISGFGFSFGEMIYPLVVVILILTFGWRITWFSSSVFIIIFFAAQGIYRCNIHDCLNLKKQEYKIPKNKILSFKKGMDSVFCKLSEVLSEIIQAAKKATKSWGIIF